MTAARLTSLAIISLALWCLPASGEVAPESGSTTGAVAKAVETTNSNSEETLRSYLQLQEQLHATRLAIERDRQEADSAAARNTEALVNRLQSIEQALAAQRAQELESMRSSNRTVLWVAVTLGSAGFLAIVLLAYSHWRALNRMEEIAASLSGDHWSVARLALAPPQSTQPDRLALGPAEQSNQRLLGAIERLEKKIHDLEHTAPLNVEEGKTSQDSSRQPEPSTAQRESPSLVAAEPVSNGNGPKPVSQPVVSNGPTNSPARDEPQSTPKSASALLSKGQDLLDRDQVEKALACFEEALAVKPDFAEAMVKKGTALERLRRFDEAMECYDQAIRADSTMTIAYLYKGGLCNRLERFNEALECYEQALRTQEKRAA